PLPVGVLVHRGGRWGVGDQHGAQVATGSGGVVDGLVGRVGVGEVDVLDDLVAGEVGLHLGLDLLVGRQFDRAPAGRSVTVAAAPAAGEQDGGGGQSGRACEEASPIDAGDLEGRHG